MSFLTFITPHFFALSLWLIPFDFSDKIFSEAIAIGFFFLEF